jgi:preprotein translocase subunit SecD
MFGASGSAACTAAGKFYGFTPVAGEHCLLSGPDPTIQDLRSGLPPAISAATGQVLSVPQGIVVVQAAPASFAHPSMPTDPSSQFYVLTDHVALLGSDITNPKQSTDSAGAPDVSFAFTARGKKHFETVTGQIAKRGALDSGPGNQLNQHFGVAIDTQLVTVPSIDFKQYPDGIIGGPGADITAGFTIQAARDLATQLRGALSLQLTSTA